MKVLITGATGFIGSHVAEVLAGKGYSLRCLVRRTSNLQWLKGLPVDFVYGDLFDETAMNSAVTGVDYIYHVAGVTKAKTKDEYFQGNHFATRNLLQAALRTTPDLKRFIHVSSQTAVGPSEKGVPIDESTPFHPLTTYGISKMESEKECLKFKDRLRITIVRPPAVYGPRDKDVFEFFKTMHKGLHPMIGLTDKFVSLIHVKDLVAGIVLAGESPKAVGETYFISSERYYHWKEVGEITSRIIGRRAVRLRIPEWGVYTVATFAEFFSLFSKKPALLNFEKARDIVQDAWTCDVSKAKKELGFRESMTLEEGIRDTVAWYRAQGWLK